MKHLQVRLEDDEYQAVARKSQQAGDASLQAAARRVLLEWAQPQPKDDLPPRILDLVRRFYAEASPEITQWVEDTMRRFTRPVSRSRAKKIARPTKSA